MGKINKMLENGHPSLHTHTDTQTCSHAHVYRHTYRMLPKMLEIVRLFMLNSQAVQALI